MTSSDTAVRGVTDALPSDRVGGRWGHLLRAEARRTFSTRGWLILLTVAAVVPGLGTAATVSQADSASVATQSGLLRLFMGGYLSSLLATLVGVTAVTAEFSHGTAARSMLLSRGRLRWAVSKLGVAIPLGLACTLIGQGVNLLVGSVGLSSKHLEHASVWHGDMLRSTIGAVSLGAICAVWGVGLGLLLRNQLAAVAGVVAYTTLVEGAPLHFWPTIGRFLPGGAQAGIALDPSVKHLGSGWAFLVLVGWAAAALVAGIFRTLRSDVPASST